MTFHKSCERGEKISALDQEMRRLAYATAGLLAAYDFDACGGEAAVAFGPSLVVVVDG